MADNPKTLNQIVKIFNDIADNHRQIEDFGYGDFSEMGTSKSINYPLMWVNYNTETIFINDSAGNPTHIEMDIEVSLSDKINNTLNDTDEHGEESTNALEVTSDIVQIKRDIIAQLTQHSFYINNGISIRTDITDEKFYDAHTDTVNEIRFVLTLRFPFNLTVCGSPFKNISISPDIDWVTITDGLNPSSPLKRYAGDSYTCVSPSLASGIAYNRPLFNGQLVSYRTNDAYWNFVNNPYSSSPSRPVSYARLLNYNTLVDNNAFGNKNRFTDENGLQVFGNNYTIDHYTGLGIHTGVFGVNLDWDDSIDAATSFSLLGFSDFRLPSVSEMRSILLYHTVGDRDLMDYTPFNTTSGSFVATSTTHPQVSTRSLMVNAVNETLYLTQNKTTVYLINSFYFRNHY